MLGAVLFSCKTDISSSDNDSDGTITGKALYSNADDHSGILVSIEKTDGLRAASISNAVDNASRSIYSSTSSRAILSNKVTASDGSYSFTNLESGTYSIYASSQNSLQKAVVTNVVVSSGRTVTASELKLTATGSITGSIIVDGTDSGNLGFVVYVAGTSYMAYTDDSGNFEISNVPAGKNYQIVVQYGTFTYSWQTGFEVSAGESKNAGAKTFTSAQIKNSIDGEDGADGSDGVDGVDGKDGTSIVWLGSFDSADEIENPQYLNAYFNKKDGCSYIYNGTSWKLLARAGQDGTNGNDGTDGKDGENGKDGISIVWLGSFASSNEIEAPTILNAYYNTTDGCSYIYTANGWTLLAKSGANGKDGADGSDGENGKDGADGSNGTDGKDGISIVWLGSFASSNEIEAPTILNAYYNTTDGCSYIYTANGWTLLAKAGTNGKNGVDGADGKDGINGTSIIWLGSFASCDEIETPTVLNAYYNTTDGCSYIYTTDGWTLLAKSGKDGSDSSDNKDKISIRWLGLHYSTPKNAENLNAYYNFVDDCSYIYTENSWQLLVKGNQNTDSIKEELLPTWLGSFASNDEITEPQVLNAYYNTTDGCSYVYTSGGWEVLEDAQYVVRKCVVSNWLGVKESADVIESPAFLDSYLNTTDGYSYIYDGENWTKMAEVCTDENIYGIGRTFELTGTNYLLVKESFYVDTKTKQAHANLLKECFGAENLVEVYNYSNRRTDNGYLKYRYALFDENKNYVFNIFDRWGTDILSSGTNAEKIVAFNKLSEDEIFKYYPTQFEIGNTSTVYGTDLSKKYFNDFKYNYSADGKTVDYDSNLKSTTSYKDYIQLESHERAMWTLSHDLIGKKYNYNLKNGNDSECISFSVYEDRNFFRLYTKGNGHMNGTTDSSVWNSRIFVSSVDASSASFQIAKMDNNVTTLAQSYSVTYSELTSDSKASEFITVSSTTTEINGQSVPEKVTFTAPFKSPTVQLQPFTAVSWKPRYDENSASIVYEPDYEEYINKYKENFVSLYENAVTDEQENITLTASTVSKDTTIPTFAFTSDSETLQIELEDMSTNFAIVADTNASGGKAGKLEDSSSYAYCYVTLPRGTYSVVLCENAPDTSSDALYFLFGDDDADNSKYRRVYPTNLGTYEETTRCPFTITADTDMTVKVTVKQNGVVKYGESGMLVDYIKFTRN